MPSGKGRYKQPLPKGQPMLSRPQTSHLITLARTLKWRVCRMQLTHHLII